MELKPYKTLLGRAQDEIVINKSRFLCYGAPCADETEALDFLKQVRGIRPWKLWIWGGWRARMVLELDSRKDNGI